MNETINETILKSNANDLLMVNSESEYICTCMCRITVLMPVVLSEWSQKMYNAVLKVLPAPNPSDSTLG